MKSLKGCFASILFSLGVFSAMAPSAMANSATIEMQSPIFGSGTISYNATHQRTHRDKYRHRYSSGREYAFE